MVVVVVLTQIGAALTTWMAPGLARVSLDTVVGRDVESLECSWAELVVAGPLSSGMAGYGVQLMGRLRSDFEEFCECYDTARGLQICLFLFFHVSPFPPHVACRPHA